MLATHAAVCRGSGAAIGDRFELPAVRPRSPGPAARRARCLAPEDDETLDVYTRALADAPQAKVDFVSKAEAGLPPRVWVGISAALFSEPGSPDRYAYEAIDAEIRHVPIGSGSLRFDGAFTALRRQTTIDPRFRPSVESMFYLWEAEITRRERDDRTVFAIGRLWPWHLPGLPMLDGAQIGRRNASGTIEGGVYGGAIPTAVTLSPIDGSWAGGLYAAATAGWPRRARRRRDRRSGWAFAIPRPPVPVREAEAVAPDLVAAPGAWGRRTASPCAARRQRAGPRAGARRPAVRPDAVGPHAGAVPIPGRRRGGPAAAAGRSADAAGRLLRWPGSVVGCVPAFRDRLAGQWQPRPPERYGSGRRRPRVRAPRLFGDLGGMAAGANAGEGWLRTRTAFVQIMARTSRLRIFGRFGAGTTQFADPMPTPLTVELGGNLQIEGVITPWLRIAARSLVRAPIVLQGVIPQDRLYGVVFKKIDLVGSFFELADIDAASGQRMVIWIGRNRRHPRLRPGRVC